MSAKNFQNQNGNSGNRSQFESFRSEWITDGADSSMVAYCETLARELANKRISSSQLRNIYGEVMRIKQKGYEKMKTDFLLLRPKVAYNAARIKSKDAKIFFTNKFVNKTFNIAHDAVNDEKTFLNFQRFFEAILAYHKLYGND